MYILVLLNLIVLVNQCLHVYTIAQITSDPIACIACSPHALTHSIECKHSHLLMHIHTRSQTQTHYAHTLIHTTYTHTHTHTHILIHIHMHMYTPANAYMHLYNHVCITISLIPLSSQASCFLGLKLQSV